MAPERRFPLGARGITLTALALAGLAAFLSLGLSPGDLFPRGESLDLAGEFFGRALNPALTYEGTHLPEGATPFLLKVLEGLRRTLVFALAAISLSLVGGIVLGFLGSTAWWEGDPAGRRRPLARVAGPVLWTLTRTVTSLMRSVHELLWAVLFLAAFGLNPLAAVLAIAIPYSGTLAKVFSEVVDEADRSSSRALRAIGARPGAVFAIGLLPRALPDMMAYTFYRSECAIRSAAILGFFGYGTLGAYVKSSFDNLHFGEVWTYLYGLFFLILLVDGLSGLLRRRLLFHA